MDWRKSGSWAKMARSEPPNSTPDRLPMPASDLLPYIFTQPRLPFAAQFAQWVEASPRFRTFAETYRDKIRKKVRGITEAEGYGDLQAELATAYFLVQERRFQVEYEKYGVGKQRGPDFSITYKTHIRFDVEVTRLRGGQTGTTPEPGKLFNTLCAKLEQLPASMINILVLAADDGQYSGDDLASGLRPLQERAERKDDELFTRRGFLGARDFLKHYSRLSAIRLITPDAPPVLRLQPQARHPLPPELATLLRR
jgi:hypothetical protein